VLIANSKAAYKISHVGNNIQQKNKNPKKMRCQEGEREKARNCKTNDNGTGIQKNRHLTCAVSYNIKRLGLRYQYGNVVLIGFRNYSKINVLRRFPE